MEPHPDEEFELEAILRITKKDREPYSRQEGENPIWATCVSLVVSYEGVRKRFIATIPDGKGNHAPQCNLLDYMIMMEPGVCLVFGMKPSADKEKDFFSLSYTRSLDGQDAYLKRVMDGDSPKMKDDAPVVTR